MIVQLRADRLDFPPPETALGPHTDAPGLLAFGGDLRPERLAAAYRQGIFPWFGEGQPILWWSLAPRMVLQVDRFKLHPSLRKHLRRFLRTPGAELRVNHATAEVIAACAQASRQGQAGTWIVPAMQVAYAEWARQGVVQSLETWRDGHLVGGLYGVRLGRMFFGESMFARETDASKLALCALVALCRRDGIGWIDCQQNTAHLRHMGAAEVAGADFRTHLRATVDADPLPPWSAPDPATWKLLLPDL